MSWRPIPRTTSRNPIPRRRLPAAHRIAANPAAPNTAKAAIWVNRVPSKLRPTTVPSGTAMKTESDDTTDDPSPARWPSGSIASALRLAKRSPNPKKTASR